MFLELLILSPVYILLPPIFFIISITLFLAVIGQSLGVRRLYIDFLLKVFEVLFVAKKSKQAGCLTIVSAVCAQFQREERPREERRLLCWAGNPRFRLFGRRRCPPIRCCFFSNERVSSDTTKVAMRILRCPMPMDIPENKFHPFLLDLFTVENEIFKKSSVNIQNYIFNASQLSNKQKGKITMINCHVCWSLSLQLRLWPPGGRSAWSKVKIPT